MRTSWNGTIVNTNEENLSVMYADKAFSVVDPKSQQILLPGPIFHSLVGRRLQLRTEDTVTHLVIDRRTDFISIGIITPDVVENVRRFAERVNQILGSTTLD